MRFWIRILSVVIIVLVVISSATYVFVALQGRNIAIQQLEKITQKKVTIGYFSLTPPFNLHIGKLNIDGMAKVDSAFISLSIPGLISGNIAFNEVKIIKPEFIYARGAVKKEASEKRPSLRRPLPVVLKSLTLKDGKLHFIDHTAGEEGIKITIKDLDFNLTNLYIWPRAVITNFQLKGRIPWQAGEEEGSIEATGWLNFFKKDMQATLAIKDIDGIYLYPYYANWVDLEKARIEKARLNFTSDIQGLNNNVTAQCHLELTDIVRKPRPPEEEQEKAEKIADAVLDIFRALNQGKIVLDFTIRTRMDRPEFGFGNIRTAFEDKLAIGAKPKGFKVQEAVAIPSNLLKSTVKSATDLSRAVIDGTFGIAKALKKAIEDTFKKEKEEEE